MWIRNVRDLIKAAEGCTLTAKPDSEGFSIGWGHNDGTVKEGDVWTQEQADEALDKSVATAVIDARAYIGAGRWSAIDAVRQAVLIDMAYELGFDRLAKFVDLRSAVQNGNWVAARDEMIHSKWAKQVPTRAERDAQMILSGSWPMVSTVIDHA